MKNNNVVNTYNKKCYKINSSIDLKDCFITMSSNNFKMFVNTIYLHFTPSDDFVHKPVYVYLINY